MSLRLSSKSKSELKGTYSYNFTLTPQYSESGLITSLVAHANSDSNQSIHLICKWYRQRNNNTYLVPEITSNIYTTTCEDIGSYIIVEVNPLTESSLGTAIGKIGPLRLDRSVRKSLEHIVNNGFAKFPLSCTGELDYNNASELVLEVSQEQLCLKTFLKDGTIDQKNSFNSSYSVTYPKIRLNSDDCRKICFEMNDSNSESNEPDHAYNKKLMVTCLNQQTRDLILMSIKVFAIKNSIKIDRAIESYLNDIGKCKTEVYLEYDNTLEELYEAHEENLELKNIINQMKAEGKEQLKQIEGYQMAIVGFEQARQSSDSTEKLRKKIARLEEDKKKLKERLEQVKNDLEGLKHQAIETLKQSEPKEAPSNTDIKRLKDSLELALQDLEIAKAKDKTCNGKLKRQKEAIENLTRQKEDYRAKIENLNEQSQNYMLLLTENKELLKKLGNANESLRGKEIELIEFKKIHEEMKSRHERSNESLMGEIDRLNEEISNCKRCEALKENISKIGSEVEFYRTQCDSLSVKLSRTSAQLKKNSARSIIS